MKTIQSTAALFLSLLAAPAGAIEGGTPETDDSNFVSIVTAGFTCGGVLLTPDLILTAYRCFGGNETQYPELISYFHGVTNGVEDNDRNPIREVSYFPPINPKFALLRLTAPLGSVGGVPATGFPLFRGNREALTNLTCFGLGPTASGVTHPYGKTLGSSNYVVTGLDGDRLILSGLPLHGFDTGGACFVNSPSGRKLAAVIMSPSEVLSIPMARPWIAEFRTRFQIIAAQSGLCVGKVPGGGGRMWQFPCADPAAQTAGDQTWMVRRVGQPNGASFQLRTQVYSGYCLGTPGGANGQVLFGPCSPDLPPNTSWPPLLPWAPRPEQLWSMQDLDDGTVQITNRMTSMCLAMGGSTSVGAFVVQAACSATAPDQRFRVDAVEFEGPPFRLERWEVPGMCTDIAGASPSDGTPVIQFTCSGDDNQNFFLARNPGTTFHYLQPSHATGEAVEVPDFSFSTGTPLRQRLFNGDKNQQWRFSWDTRGAFRLIMRYDGQCMTAQGFGGGTKLLQDTCQFDLWGHANRQTWLVE